MTQLGEDVQIGEVYADEVECPFDHESVEPPTVKNDLIGKGGTLAGKMKRGESTHLYAPLRKKQAEVKNPREVSGHPFFAKAKVVSITATDSASGKIYVHTYPVTCAAHHLIPAQESLKESPLLAYMVKKGDSEDIKDGSYSSGVVWADVGYDVNGVENGVNLPGSYAVGGGRGGMGLWTGNDDAPDLEEEDPTDAGNDPSSPELTGALNQIADTNRKWLYVSQTMKLAPGHFHDRHQDYSAFVQDVLSQIHANYVMLERFKLGEAQCPKCKDRRDKIAKLGVPTPFGLVARLTGLSGRLRGCLSGGAWRPNIYTSKWGRAYMKSLKKPQGAPG